MTEHTTESCHFYHDLFSFLLLSGLLRHDALEEMVFDPPISPPYCFFGLNLVWFVVVSTVRS